MRFAFVLKLYQIKHHLYADLLGLFVWSPENECVGQVVQTQISTVAHKNPKNSDMVVVKSKLKIHAWKPEGQQTDMTSVYEICQKTKESRGYVLTCH